MNKERLLNVAKALRESPNPGDFRMSSYATGCGTPACALGHYAARSDLQSAFAFQPGKGPYGAVCLGDTSITHGHESVRDHFDISADEVSRLFACEGEAIDFVEAEGMPESTFLSLSAGSANAAADWIERFVAEHS